MNDTGVTIPKVTTPGYHPHTLRLGIISQKWNDSIPFLNGYNHINLVTFFVDNDIAWPFPWFRIITSDGPCPLYYLYCKSIMNIDRPISAHTIDRRQVPTVLVRMWSWLALSSILHHVESTHVRTFYASYVVAQRQNLCRPTKTVVEIWISDTPFACSRINTTNRLVK